MKQLLLIDSFSSDETEIVAAELASVLRPGDVLALYGPLGSGKTAFVKGLAAGLKCSLPVRSPSFSLINEYPGPLPLYHIDFYRLENEAEIADLGWTEYLSLDGVVAIEWAERVKKQLPEIRYDIYLSFLGPDIRRLEIIAHGDIGNR